MDRNREELLKKYLEQGGPLAEYLRKQRSQVGGSNNPEYIADLYNTVSKTCVKIRESDGQFTGGWYVERWENDDFYFDFTFSQIKLMEMESYSKTLYNSNEV